MTQPIRIDAIFLLSRLLHSADTGTGFWKVVEDVSAAFIGFNLLTILVYDEVSGITLRTYTTQPGLQPVGARKRVTDSMWSNHVLKTGQIFKGSTRETISEVFPEHELLAQIGCESVLNIPIRSNVSGKVIGSMNLLGQAHQYDDIDIDSVTLIAQLVSGPLELRRSDILQTQFSSSPTGSV